ncbi:MAG: zinc-regulated TonB-dependent outer membrane receptor [Proteobacteria bacterium]|nr:zinc-regulated TonB-dependent outer membrane receptor [Pseudomonadota bacterium]
MKHIPAVIVSMCTLLASIPVYAQEISVESQNPNDFQDASASKIVPSAPAAAPDATMQQSSEGLPESTSEDAVPLKETTAPSESSSAEESKSIAEAAPTPIQDDSASAETHENANASQPLLQDDSASADSQELPALTPEEEAELLAALEQDASAKAEGNQEAAQNTTNPVASFVQSMNPDLAFIADFALAWFSDKDNYQQGAHDPTKIGFNLQQLEMSISASVDHLFRFDSNLVFSLAGVEIEEAVATTTALPGGLQVRAGQFLSRVGRINATHPHTWDFVDQVFMISKFYGPEGNRGLGLELSWLTPLPWYLEIAAAAQMPGSSASNRSFMNSTSEIDGVQDLLYTFTLKQFFPFGDETGLLWGLSAQTAPNETGRDNRTLIFGTDLTLKYTPHAYPEMQLVFQSEALFRIRQIPGAVLQDGAGYAQLVWQINRQWATGLRGEYGSGLKDDPLDPYWTDHRARAAVQATWTPSHFTRLRAQGSMDFPMWRSPIYALMLALEINVGTHPAHSY